MGRPRTVSDEAIRGAAREVFIEAGPAASVGLVAARLGVTQAALFQRVGSKRALMRSALSPSWREARAIVRALEAPPPPRGVDTQAKAILSELGRFLAEVIPNLVVLRAAGPAMEQRGAPPEGVPPTVRFRAALTRWLERAASAGAIEPLDAEATAEALLGAIEARCFNAYLGGRAFAPGDDEAFVCRMVEAFIHPLLQGER